jgi:hypothetical protein
MERARRADPLDGDHLATVHRAEQEEAAVDRLVACLPIGRGRDQRHRAGAALPLGAALLATGQALLAQPSEQRQVRVGIAHLDIARVQSEADRIVHGERAS